MYRGGDLGLDGTEEAEAAMRATTDANGGNHVMLVRVETVGGNGKRRMEEHHIDGLGDVRAGWAINSAYKTK